MTPSSSTKRSSTRPSLRWHFSGLGRVLARLARFAGWPRRIVAAALLVTAVVLAVAERSADSGPAPPASHTAVLAAARDLPAGTVLRSADVRPLPLPSTLVPTGALRPGFALEGRRLAGPVRRGEPLTDVRLAGPGLAAGLRAEGMVAVPLRLADAGTAELLHPGDRVDILATMECVDLGLGPPGCAGAKPTRGADTALGQVPVADVIAADVTVLAGPPRGSEPRGEGALVVVAASPEEARRIAGSAGSGAGTSRLTVTLRPP